MGRADRDDEAFPDAVGQALEANHADTRTWVNMPVDEAQRLSAVLYSSGEGDGTYLCYAGVTEDGEPT